jgi:hypothetical protein
VPFDDFTGHDKRLNVLSSRVVRYEQCECHHKYC